MKDQIKELIPQVDALANAVKEVGLTSGELKNCHNALLFSKAWLGMTMGTLGESTPYKNDGKRETVADIEPTANKADFNIGLPAGEKTKQIDFLREEIKNTLTKVEDVRGANANQYSSNGTIYMANCFSDLTRAKMWLGFELGRMRDEALNIHLVKKNDPLHKNPVTESEAFKSNTTLTQESPVKTTTDQVAKTNLLG